MPYYITKEIINKEIINIFSSANATIDAISKLEESLNNASVSVFKDKFYISVIKNLQFNKQNILDVADLLFQVKDYKFYLHFLNLMFLETEHFEEICLFYNRTFVNHIGEIKYNSSIEIYDFSERYFDRFVESIKYCEIDNYKIIPFLFAIYESNKESVLSKWKRTSREFLKNFIIANAASYLQFISNEKFYFLGYKIYIDLFPDKGALKIIDNLIVGNYYDKDQLIDLFISTKEIGINSLINYIVNSSDYKQKLALEFYLGLGAIIKPTLQQLYEKVSNENIKAILKDELDLAKNVKFETIKDFIQFAELNAVNYNVTNISNSYLIYFKNGIKASDHVISYIFHLFKNIVSTESIKKYGFLKNFFEASELNNLGFNLLSELNTKITNENKWVVALIAAVCENDVIDKLINIVPSCLSLIDVSSFVLGCLSQTKNELVVKLLKQLYLESNNKQFYFSFLETSATLFGISALDYLDEMVSNFGFSIDGTKNVICNGENLLFEISDNLSVKVKNLNTNKYMNIVKPNFVDTANALQLFNDLTHEIKVQIDKFKDSFLYFRVWKPQVFKTNILSHPILLKIAKTLVFGVYEKDKLLRLLNFEKIDEVNNESYIALVHPCELDIGTLQLIMGKFEPFNQINQKVFVASDYEYNNNYSLQFNGIAVSDIPFNASARLFGYKMIAGDDVYYYKTLNNENLFIKLEITKLSFKNESIVGNIKFYNLNLIQFINNKYNLNDIEPIQIGSIDKRIFSNLLNEIYLSCFN